MVKHKQAKASSRKTQLVDKIRNNKAGIRKRKMLAGETLPHLKKQNVVGLMSLQSNALTCKSRKSKEMSLIYPGDDLRGQDVGKCSKDFGERHGFVVGSVRPDTVTSIRIVDKVPLDFRCTICKELPRLLNRSELYRHYSFRHFYSKLMKEFGHLKTCPVCKVDLKTNSIPSHFGQKHSHVEHFLPVEAWIPISKVGSNISRGSIGRGDKGSKEKLAREVKSKGKLKKVEGKVNSLKEVPWVWPEIPQGFNHDGHERGVKSGFHLSKQPFRIATVNGFDIELDVDDDQENMVQCSELCSSASACEQVMQCRICKKVFDTKQLAVLHVQTTHDMKGSGDEIHDCDALLRSGHIAPELSMNTAGVEVVKSHSCELSSEELELDMAAETIAQNKAVHDLADTSTDMEENYKTIEDWENVCDTFEAKLKTSGVKAKPTGEEDDKREWEAACVAFEVKIVNICDSSDVLGMSNVKAWQEIYQLSEEADGSADREENDKAGEDWETVRDTFESRLEASGVQAEPIEEVDKSDQEWEVACVAFESMIANICDSSDLLGMTDAHQCGEVFAVESIKDLQVTDLGSRSSAISGYIRQHKAESS